MAITKYRIKKWIKMLFGNSILHVNQPVGQHYSFEQIAGYYNDLSQKVLKDKKTIKTNQVPRYPDENGVEKEFSIGVFQYALGAHELIGNARGSKYERKFWQCVDWALAHQNENGGYYTFDLSKLVQSNFSSMAQAEAASMFIRAYVLSHDEQYLLRARQALDYMLKDESEGGCSRYVDGGLILMEYPLTSPVLNGWIFSVFGLMDACIVFDDARYHDALEKTLHTLKEHLPNFSTDSWSLYNEAGIIASPFYHKLHCALLDVLFDYSKDDIFDATRKKWRRQYKNPILRLRAMRRKFIQKAKE